MADFRLEAETRTEFGKGSARRTRRAGRIPAVLYGHGQDVVHLSLPAREFAAALRNGGSNALLTIVLDGKVICYLHCWEFDLRTGVCDVGREWNVKTYPVREVDGRLQVQWSKPGGR